MMWTFSAMQSVLVGLLLAGSGSVAAGMGNSGKNGNMGMKGDSGCNGGPPGGLTYGGACPANCFDTPYAQVVKVAGGAHTDSVVGISQCIKPSGSISFITYGPPDAYGQCSGANSCGSNKVEDVAAGATFVDLVVPAGSCEGDPICVYVHDGQLKKGSGGTPEPNVPADCTSSPNQLCAMCGSYLVTPRLVSGEPCTDPYTCTTGDVCGADAVCAGTPDDHECDDGASCTEDICVAGGAADGIDGHDLLTDGSGCGYRPSAAVSCDDGFSCTTDLCVALPSVTSMQHPDSGTGCVSEPDDAACATPEGTCAVGTCVPDMYHPDGIGCVTTEIIPAGSHVGFCEGKYPECTAAVCSLADGVSSYGPHTVEADGCSLQPSSHADALCTDPECAESFCDPSPTADGGGCTVDAHSLDNSVCEAGLAGCQSSTCSADGTCSAPTEIHGFCDDVHLSGFGPIGTCSTAECLPDQTHDASGCVAVAVTPDPCTVPEGQCGTSVCDVATGDCDENFSACGH